MKQVEAARHEHDELALAFPFPALEDDLLLRDNLPQFPAPSSSGHGFSRALTGAKIRAASAAEGPSQSAIAAASNHMILPRAIDWLRRAILVTALAIFSIFQRLGTDALRHRTASAAAAALFNAILAAWFIAAAFPLT
jgi:hypothetical protein